MKIVLLADFPLHLISPKITESTQHYATWLASLYHIFKQQSSWDIHWIILSRHVNQAECIRIGRQNFHIIPRTRKTIGLYSLYLYDRRRIAECIHRIKPHMIHAWGTEDCYALAGAHFTGKKILSVQGLLRRCVQLSPMDRFTRHQSLYESYALRSYPVITGESPYACKHIAQLSPQSYVLPFEYAVDQIFFDSKRRLTSKPSFLFAGTCTKRKNIDLLLQAFQDKRLANYTLKLAGVAKEDILLPEDKIIALGRLTRQELCDEMSSSWALLTPSLTETGPTVVKEARVMGLPVITTHECGSKQYVEEGASGFIIDSTDKESLIKGIIQLSHSMQHNIDMGVFHQEYCRKALSLDTMRYELTSLYQQVLTL